MAEGAGAAQAAVGSVLQHAHDHINGAKEKATEQAHHWGGAFLRAVDGLTLEEQFGKLVLLTFAYVICFTTFLALVKCCCVSKKKSVWHSKTNCCLKSGIFVFGGLVWLLSALLALFTFMEWFNITPWQTSMKLKQAARTPDWKASPLFTVNRGAMEEALEKVQEKVRAHTPEEVKAYAEKQMAEGKFLSFLCSSWEAVFAFFLALSHDADDKAFWRNVLQIPVPEGEGSDIYYVTPEWVKALVFYLGLVAFQWSALLLTLVFIGCLVCCGKKKEETKDEEEEDDDEDEDVEHGKTRHRGEAEPLVAPGNQYANNFQYA